LPAHSPVSDGHTALRLHLIHRSQQRFKLHAAWLSGA
jgi:hypothetical protein